MTVKCSVGIDNKFYFFRNGKRIKQPKHFDTSLCEYSEEKRRDDYVFYKELEKEDESDEAKWLNDYVNNQEIKMLLESKYLQKDKLVKSLQEAIDLGTCSSTVKAEYEELVKERDGLKKEVDKMTVEAQRIRANRSSDNSKNVIKLDEELQFIFELQKSIDSMMANLSTLNTDQKKLLQESKTAIRQRIVNVLQKYAPLLSSAEKEKLDDIFSGYELRKATEAARNLVQLYMTKEQREKIDNALKTNEIGFDSISRFYMLAADVIIDAQKKKLLTK